MKKYMMSDWNMSHKKCLILFHFHYLGSFQSSKCKTLMFKVIEILQYFSKEKDVWKSPWNTWAFFDKKNMMSDLNISHENTSDFLLFGFTVVIKLKIFAFKSHWNTWIFCDKKRYGIRFNYVPWKKVWFCFIAIAWVLFSHKTKKFLFLRSLKCFNIFW